MEPIKPGCRPPTPPLQESKHSQSSSNQTHKVQPGHLLGDLKVAPKDDQADIPPRYLKLSVVIPKQDDEPIELEEPDGLAGSPTTPKVDSKEPKHEGEVAAALGDDERNKCHKGLMQVAEKAMAAGQPELEGLKAALWEIVTYASRNGRFALLDTAVDEIWALDDCRATPEQAMAAALKALADDASPAG